MRRNFALALVAVMGIMLSVGCASAPRRDLSRLQGTWDGKELGGGEGECRISISGDSIRFQGTQRRDWYIGKLTLIPHTNPRQVNVHITECGFAQYVNQTAKAIYKTDGKALTLAGHEPGNSTVPTAFGPSTTNQTRAFIFTKQ